MTTLKRVGKFIMFSYLFAIVAIVAFVLCLSAVAHIPY